MISFSLVFFLFLWLPILLINKTVSLFLSFVFYEKSQYLCIVK